MSTCNAICALLVTALFVSTLSAQSLSNSDNDDYIPTFDTGLRHQFDWDLLKGFVGSAYKNVIVSPISLKIVLALLYEGAGGSTEQELQAVLGLNPNKTIVRREYMEIIDSLLNSNVPGCEDVKANEVKDMYTLSLGTRMYLDRQLSPQQPFQSKACDKYRTKIESTDFSDAIRASSSVNNWVNKLTMGKISKLVEADDVKETVLLIANAIYFKGFWKHRFPANQSHSGGFYLSPTDVANVHYMATTDEYFFSDSKELDSKIIRIPYKGRKYSMIIVLPNAKAGLAHLIQNLNVVTLRNSINVMDKMTVDLILPKFKFDFAARMSTILRRMGLVSMFQHTASLAGISRGSAKRLVVSDIVQKAGIEIDEEGTVAYAATDVQITNKFGEAQIVFNATHPFLFFIEDQQTHTIVFAGKVENPLEDAAVPLPSRFGGTDQASNENNAATAEGAESISDTEPFHLNPSWNDQEQAIAKRFNYFDLELLREVATDENVFVSPASIKATLAMVLEGANGVCAEEIVKTLRLPLNQNDSRNQLKPLLYDLNDKNRNSLLESANGMFVNNRLNILDSYRHTIESYYRGFVRPVNFTNIIQATNTINNWVSNVTRGFIQRIVGPENVNPSSSLLITNALFFKGTWKHAFDERQTKPKCFEPPTRECINVHMMSNTADLNYRLIDDVDAHALELPYSDEKYAMLILLPRIKNNIHALMRDLQHASFNSIMDKLERTEVMYELPRFDIDFSMDLVKPLQQLGIREIFGDRANLTGIVANQQIFVDSVVHKTKIEVNERGTTAAAVTGAVVIPLMGSSSPKVIADHPFAFFIYRKDNRNILFEGIVNRPVEAALESRSNFNYVPNNKFNGRGARRLTNYGT